MKKIISFEKKLEFPSMIGEITAISLDHDLKFTNESSIEGNFTISGSYKLTEASRIEEKFEFKLPVDIVLNEKLDLATSKVEVDDFYYEIDHDDTLISYIDVKVEGVEQIDIQEEELTREEEKEEIIESEVATIEPLEEEKQETAVKEEQKPTITDAVITEEVPVINEDLIKDNLSPKIERECDGDNTYQNDTEEIKEMETQEMLEENTNEQEQTMGSLFSSLKESDETFSTYSVYILRQEETVQSLIEKYKTTKEELESYNDLSNLTIGSKIIIPLQND